ncbi:division/cell wall cluster transcriptional repressor MraZ [Candidatus Roizmanbacteria bacterium RIFCSPHIGHO2_02_FULL_40_13b]|uniref:Transcriptional regulator MraZ n=1 Tax=Candidatus Roizmanbacteria bacterium RIFCSPHIGHO2_01_FULL_39_24 TaxID=1802032 RepID=A0A1F7GK97_9BACT|nr:MAG: division/cell wall cluster transcriptional repressor MraZ [Candidatus Roizmanbacteria bacterium RIFCSPHIGHO2_01_FULL_39_24]OGK28070.1 MAG: division/cell wall cluster transcriptional repressor MraZ [Candidatus Roizmanbacteria bacterium RIFCSPHIGHO2_02_FULL_40_13b]OGK49579.1 MAG: division/cell wall cluster transcriptional repressor MraZ [Candidatus Roizmanbacteria bacterium RIFCSPLOWO2_01_FULL_40_32]OGK57025.1 MAG: division/cell wall cluster transcriptional repressor MraZ [Candidatus Roizm
MAFIGEYKVSVTAGGRVVLPKKIRASLKGELFILTKGFDVCLGGYDLTDWKTRTEALLHVSLLDQEDIARRRQLFSGANEIEVDAQGRFVVPKSLANFIGNDFKDVVVIGVGDHFEIWSGKSWRNYAHTSVSK